VLGFLRFFPLIPICLATSGTLPIPPAVSFALLAVSTPLILWALYAAVVHFGYTRASGADHFDPAYRQGTFEKKGIYRYVPNAMYSVVLLILYHGGLFWFSALGCVVAAAHHAFVWVHYFCTEKPDIREIYGS
jgi:hypothetical protein